MKKILKHLKKNWKIHAGYILAITMALACITIVMSLKEIKALRTSLKDAEQTLQECRHTLGVWEAQVESGSIKIIKRDGDTETIERWEMKRGYEVGDEVGWALK